MIMLELHEAAWDPKLRFRSWRVGRNAYIPPERVEPEKLYQDYKHQTILIDENREIYIY